jgi:hypothetical protein
MFTPFSSRRLTRPKQTVQHRRPAVERLEPGIYGPPSRCLSSAERRNFNTTPLTRGSAIEALGAGHECPHR